MPKLESVSYGGWQHCHKLSNGIIDLVITGDVGPRIIRLGFADGPNLLCEVAEQLGKTTGDDWRIYGGHRFWHAPEHPVRTYYPDNDPVSVEEQNGTIVVTQATEPTTQLQKQLELRMDHDKANVEITHRLFNHGQWPVELAPWALSVMTTGGTAVIPHPPRGTHPEALLPANTLTLWPYTNMGDPRWTWGEKYILLRQDVNTNKPQKVGVDVPDGWAAYIVHDTAFIKRFSKQPGAHYPDHGSVVETFTNDFMLELETLGPITKLEPGQSVSHTETWFLFKDVPTPHNDREVETALLPLVNQTRP